ncbi:MAG TPA: hypothetical protein DGG94_19590 [Micromonosporaceae bacterium]|nr:hypothetical protein [Micromonosporaceae bacterium]
MSEKYAFDAVTDRSEGASTVEYQDGTLITEENTGLTFLVMSGKLSSIENGDLFDVSDTTMVDTAKLEELRREGGPAVSPEAYLAIADGRGYLVNNGQKQYFTSEDAIKKYHFNRGKFQEKMPADLPEASGPDLG